MAFDCFRDFVNALDRADELKRISQPVDSGLGITVIADRDMKPQRPIMKGRQRVLVAV